MIYRQGERFLDNGFWLGYGGESDRIICLFEEIYSEGVCYIYQGVLVNI